MKSYWQEKAAKLPEQTLTRFGQLLEKTLRHNRNPLLAELVAKGDLKAFLLVQQAEMKDSLDLMVEQGADPRQAQEQVLTDALEGLAPLEPLDDQAEQDENAEAAGRAFFQSQPPT